MHVYNGGTIHTNANVFVLAMLASKRESATAGNDTNLHMSRGMCDPCWGTGVTETTLLENGREFRAPAVPPLRQRLRDGYLSLVIRIDCCAPTHNRTLRFITY